MKLKLVIGVAALQVLVLAFMAGQREWIMHTGTPLTLRTAPIDPNDPMRGAYVRLNYEISTISAASCRGETAQWTKLTDWRKQRRLRDRVVYTALKINEHGLAELVDLREHPPASGPFLRGRVVHADTNGVRVRYGIEALFMPKETAVKTESMAIKEKAGAPMAVEVAVGSSGTAVIRRHSWEPLGLTITPRRRPENTTDPQPANRPRRPITEYTLTLHNYGDEDLAIVDLPGGSSFRLVPNTLINPTQYVWSRTGETRTATPTEQQIIVLKPGASHAIQIDLTQPEWWVLDTTKPEAAAKPLSEIDHWHASFRFEYAPPSPEAVRGLPHADLVRHVPLRSRAFSSFQGID